MEAKIPISEFTVTKSSLKYKVSSINNLKISYVTTKNLENWQSNNLLINIRNWSIERVLIILCAFFNCCCS